MVTRTASCRFCPSMFYYTANSFRGKGRVACDKCATKRRRLQTKARVRKLREKRSKITKRNKRYIVHLERPGSLKTYCGTKQDDGLVGRILYGAGACDWRYCYTCAAMFEKATGARLTA